MEDTSQGRMLVRRGREECLEETGLAVMCDVAEGQRQPQVERVQELVLGEIGLHEADELTGEVGLFLRPFPLGCRELVGGEIADRPEHRVLPSKDTALQREKRSGFCGAFCQ